MDFQEYSPKMARWSNQVIDNCVYRDDLRRLSELATHGFETGRVIKVTAGILSFIHSDQGEAAGVRTVRTCDIENIISPSQDDFTISLSNDDLFLLILFLLIR